MTSHLHPIHLTHEINTRHGRRYFGVPVGANYIGLPQNIQLCHISPTEYANESNILYLEVHRVDTDPDELTDKEKKMETQLSQNKILEVRIASQDVGEENFAYRQWFRWFVHLAT